MTGVILRRWLLSTALNMAGHEGNHVVERIYFHSCEYSWNHHRHNISRDVARGTATGGVAGMASESCLTQRNPNSQGARVLSSGRFSRARY